MFLGRCFLRCLFFSAQMWERGLCEIWNFSLPPSSFSSSLSSPLPAHVKNMAQNQFLTSPDEREEEEEVFKSLDQFSLLSRLLLSPLSTRPNF